MDTKHKVIGKSETGQPIYEATDADMKPDWEHECDVCGEVPTVPLTGLLAAHDAQRGKPLDAYGNEIHSCSYYCERPECIRRQRNEMRAMFEQRAEYHSKSEMKRVETLKRAESGAGVPDIETMVTRFLGWQLPDDFSPDNGISYTPITRMPGWTHDTHPSGTNLFTADQAKAMFEYVLAAAPEKDKEPRDGR